MPLRQSRTSSPRNAPQKVFGVVLRELRQTQGYSQDTLAHHTGYHRNYVGQLERGEKSPSLKALFDFAQSFGLKPSDLLRRMEKRLG